MERRAASAGVERTVAGRFTARNHHTLAVITTSNATAPAPASANRGRLSLEADQFATKDTKRTKEAAILRGLGVLCGEFGRSSSVHARSVGVGEKICSGGFASSA